MRARIGIITGRTRDTVGTADQIRYSFEAVESGSPQEYVSGANALPDRPPSFLASDVDIMPAPVPSPCLVYYISGQLRFIALWEEIATGPLCNP